MAKRTVPSPQADSGTDASSLPDTSVCFSLVDDHEPFHGVEQHVSHSSEEGTPSEAVAASDVSTECAKPHERRLEWTFCCPFCCTAKLVDPVELHSPVDTGCAEASPRHCLACRACAEQWSAALGIVDAAASSHALDTNPRSSSRRPSQSVVQPTCPLCDCSYPKAPAAQSFVSLTDHSQSETAYAMLCDPDTVNNSFTGVAPLSEEGDSRGRGASVKNCQLTSATSTTYCGVCEEQKATCLCFQCDFGLCDACHNVTHSKGRFKQHEVAGLDQARRRNRLKCPEHAGMLLDLYCETCATCVCVTCCFGGAHRGHEVFPLADVAERTAETLKSGARVLADTRRKTTAMRAELTTLLPLYDAKVRAVETDIQRCFSSLRRILQEREDALLKELRTAAADVKKRSMQLQSSTGALADLLDTTSAVLTKFAETVSPVTLMRVAPQVQAQQAWTLQMASRLTEEVATTVDGWNYQLGEEGVNGCRMVCFDMLNAQTSNDKGILQYQQVLADLGRLDVSTELQPPAVRTSGVGSRASQGDEEEDEEAQEPHRGVVERSAVEPIVERRPEKATPSQDQRKERSTSSSTTKSAGVATLMSQGAAKQRADAAEDDAPRLRPSHVSEVPAGPSTSFNTLELPPTSRSTETHLTSDVSVAPRFSRVAALRSVASSADPSSLPRSLSVGGLAEEGSFVVSTESRTMLQARSVLLDSERRGSKPAAAVSAHAAPNSLRLRSEDAMHLARDTIPFRVSMPQKRTLSLDRIDDGLQLESNHNDSGPSSSSSYSSPSLSWHAWKLRRTSVTRDTATADVAARTCSLPGASPSSAWQQSGSTRLSFFSDFDVSKPTKSNGVSPVRGLNIGASSEEHRGTVRRKTTGLQLEL
jgi:hypothetical protein